MHSYDACDHLSDALSPTERLHVHAASWLAGAARAVPLLLGLARRPPKEEEELEEAGDAACAFPPPGTTLAAAAAIMIVVVDELGHLGVRRGNQATLTRP